MDHDVGVRYFCVVVCDDAGEKLPLGCGHRALYQVVFGIDLVRHDETRVDDHGRFL